MSKFIDSLNRTSKVTWNVFVTIITLGIIRLKINPWIKVAVLAVLYFNIGISYYSIDRIPNHFDVRTTAKELANDLGVKHIQPGFVTMSTLYTVENTLLNKPWGLTANDVTPPTFKGCFADNMPWWEFGVQESVRDLAMLARYNLSRQQGQGDEDPKLSKLHTLSQMSIRYWLFPAAEWEYEKGLKALQDYLVGLDNSIPTTGNFYIRADNLRDTANLFAQRLGAFSTQLSQNAGREVTTSSTSGTGQSESKRVLNAKVLSGNVPSAKFTFGQKAVIGAYTVTVTGSEFVVSGPEENNLGRGKVGKPFSIPNVMSFTITKDMLGGVNKVVVEAEPLKYIKKNPYVTFSCNGDAKDANRDIDDIYWTVRGYTWALLQYAEALRVDFDTVLKDKNAVEIMDQIIVSLKDTHKSLELSTMGMVFNGEPLGVFANHSVVLRSAVASAQTGFQNLAVLLQDG